MIEKLSSLEVNHDTSEIFRFKNTTSWINIKNYLYAKSLPNSIRSASTAGYLGKNGIYLFFLSIFHYIKLIFRAKVSNLYIGAGSGLFSDNGKSLDSYLPSNELNCEPLIYLLSAEHPRNLMQHHTYLKEHDVVIYSYLLAPLKVIFTKIYKFFIKFDIPEDFYCDLEKCGFVVTKEELIAVHTKFIVSYYLYKTFLYPFNLSKSYVVSAYSNTELVSILKGLNVEIIELQHGLIGSTHRAYNYKCQSALLPTPDNVFVYNEFWKEELINAGYYKPNQIAITGRLKYSLVDSELTMPGKKFVVFTGQGGFYDEILVFFRDSEAILSDNNLELLYLPHPNEGGEALDDFFRNAESLPSINILLNKEFTTEQYIYNSLAHISVYSSCHFDSIHYKQKTYIFDVMEDNPMKYYMLSYPERYICLKDLDERVLMQNKISINEIF